MFPLLSSFTAAFYAAPDGAFDQGKLCTFPPVWQWAVERWEQALWIIWKCIIGWSIWLLLATYL